MRVCKCRVDLYGPGVALEGALYVVHLLQSVTHVGIGVGKRRLNPGEREKKTYNMLPRKLIWVYTYTIYINMPAVQFLVSTSPNAQN
jgi:hypothetical protein